MIEHTEQPIGVFDSGVGGLTVVRELQNRLPGEAVVYLGDTARVPYGTKSPETVIRYARACAAVLIQRDAKAIVMACNTATAFALDTLRHELAVPVIGVIEPGARKAVALSPSGVIGVIGTAGTIRSGAYQRAIAALAPAAVVHARPCPLFVPLAEEGWLDGPVTESIVRTYLQELLDAGIDTLILGCTHYPILKETIGRIAGNAITLVDSAEAVSDVMADTLAGMGMAARANGTVHHAYLVTDSPEGFARLGQRFLGDSLGSVQWVDIG